MTGPTLAVDCGGSRIKAAAVSAEGDLLGEVRTTASAATAQEALRAVVDIGRPLVADHGCVRVGLCVPGLVDERGVVVSLPGKLEGIVGLDLPQVLRSELGLPATVVNDALAYGLGEAAAGAGAGSRSVVVMTVGTGVGVSVMHDGVPAGTGTCRGGILGGQIPISGSEAGPTDTSGRAGTIEALCRADRLTGPWGGVPETYRAYAQGNPDAMRTVTVYRGHLGRAIVALAHAHSPEVVVVGGGPMAEDAPVFDGLQDEVDAATWPGYRVRVAPAVLGDAAALVGLARLG